MSRRLHTASANTPMNGAKNTYDKVKANFNKGAHHTGAFWYCKCPIVTMSSALSANADKNWAVINHPNPIGKPLRIQRLK
jgi:hypothetical protein